MTKVKREEGEGNQQSGVQGREKDEGREEKWRGVYRLSNTLHSQHSRCHILSGTVICGPALFIPSLCHFRASAALATRTHSVRLSRLPRLTEMKQVRGSLHEVWMENNARAYCEKNGSERERGGEKNRCFG